MSSPAAPAAFALMAMIGRAAPATVALALARAALFALALALVSNPMSAQVVPNARWQTIRTEHFRVHYTPELESQARRAAGNAERAWTRLSRDLVAPRGPVDLVIADNVDFTNGYATFFPTNRIVIYAHPPVHTGSLRFYDDWSELVITHELVHIFHLDRSTGWWRVAQRVFGRDPIWFPNAYLPSWIIEGFAVYEESRHTGAGRLASSGHRMVARASALGGHVPRLDELSASTSRFPGGGGVYVYGSLLFEFLAQTRGEAGMRKFVERTSAAPLPWLLNRQSKKSFGVTLEQAWREWRDSLSRTTVAGSAPLQSWKELTPRGRYVFHPRWMGDSALIYVGSTGKEVLSAYRVNLQGSSERLGRRSAFDPNVPLADGSVLYSELEFVTPYEVRSDLWIQQGTRTRRLTRDARLSYADARADRRIVAVQAIPGSTRIVLLAADGSALTPITSGTEDVQWAEPRWSPDGGRIAAIRLNRGAVSEIVLLDTSGSLAVVTRERAVVTGLSWKSSDELAFTSDRSGAMQIQVARLAAEDSGAGATVRQSSAVGTGVFSPEFSRKGDMLAAVHYRSDGYHLGVGTLAEGVEAVLSDSVTRRDSFGEPLLVRSAATRYRPWRSLVPRYWRLAGEGSADETVLGASTSGADIVGRHDYVAQVQRSLDYPEGGGYLLYRYSGLGMPLLDVTLSQSHEQIGLINKESLRERTRYASVATTLLRPRVRSSAYASVGVALERDDYSTYPAGLLARLNPRFRETSSLQTLRGSGGWSNARRPELSISRENGVGLDGFGRVRQLVGNGGRSHQVVGIARGYRAFDLGGWAHHVLAVRVAGGLADPQFTSRFSVGGTSGGSLEVIPGFDVGSSNETFGVRGFPAGTRTGLRAVGATVELRGPLFAPSRGYRILPFFLDRTSFALFGEGASAWCPETQAQFLCRSAPFDHRAIISAGGELRFDTAIQYDAPVEFRLGVAAPVAGRNLSPDLAPPRRVSVYFTVGTAY